MEDGSAVAIKELKEGDKILAAAADGSLYHDVVSRFSLARPDARTAFVQLTTAKASLALTETHHLPVGPLRELKQAKDVTVGDTIWLADAATAALAPQAVQAVDVLIDDGLHNPLLRHGGMPIVDGVATAFNSAPIVAFDSVAVPIVEALCEATNTCTTVRKAIASVECAAKHLLHAHPTCKTFRYVDGAVAGGRPAVDPLVAGILTLALATMGTALSAVRARK